MNGLARAVHHTKIAVPAPGPRARCKLCLRAQSACWCRWTRPTGSATRVCFLQHPREHGRAIGTAWIAHRSLPNSELHVGVDFAGHARVQGLVEARGTALLFPGPGARDPATLQPGPQTLIVLDGTWSQARKLLRLNPWLEALPRIGFQPRQKSRYRIRREPADHCVSTIEAVVHVLSALERDEEKFAPILGAFERMVDHQLECAARRPGAARRKIKGPPRPIDDGLSGLRARRTEAVAIYAEANAHAKGSGVPGAAELIHLVALRPATGERFEAIVAPRRPLAPRSPDHLRVPAERLLAGEPIDAALRRFAAFVRETDLYVGWGDFSLSLLRSEGAPARGFHDLRPALVRRLQRNPGGLDGALAALGIAHRAAPLGEGRAGARLAALGQLFGALMNA